MIFLYRKKNQMICVPMFSTYSTVDQMVPFCFLLLWLLWPYSEEVIINSWKLWTFLYYHPIILKNINLSFSWSPRIEDFSFFYQLFAMSRISRKKFLIFISMWACAVRLQWPASTKTDYIYIKLLETILIKIKKHAPCFLNLRIKKDLNFLGDKFPNVGFDFGMQIL